MIKKYNFLLVAIVLLAFSPCLWATTYNDLPQNFRNKWEALLHYGHGRSALSSDSNFFLSNNGATNPASELLATINSFEKDPSYKCQFPARTYLLFEQLPDASCSGYLEYKEFVSAESISLVFASESETSPVSSMGHVFLVLEGHNAKGLYKRHAVAFVADTSVSQNLLIEFLKDSIIGRYVLNPYDDLIYNYVSEEQRSLWEYKLNLSEEEKKWLFLHLYELKEHSTKYSFFTHNCATGLNRVLAVASSNLLYPNDRLYITPVEYIQHIYHTGRVHSIVVRPSYEDQFRLESKYPLDPLKTNKTSRIKIGFLYDHYLKHGVNLEFLPFSHDISEATEAKTQLNESKFFEIKTSFFS